MSGFTVSALTDYVAQNKMDLIGEIIALGDTINYIPNIQTGVKTTDTINRLNLTIAPVSGASCGFTAAGTTELTQRSLTVGSIQIQDNFCIKDLEAKYTQENLRKGSKANEDIYFEKLFVDQLIEQVQEYNDKLIWQGDTAGSGELSLTDGLLTILDADALLSPPTINYDTFTAATFGDSTNAIDIVDEMIDSLPENMTNQKDLILFMPYSLYRKYTKQLRTGNFFHFSAEDNKDGQLTIVHPGADNVKVVGIHGMVGTNALVLTSQSNYYLGVDGENDFENVEMWWSQDDRVVKYDISYKLGVNFSWLENVVYRKGI